MSKVIDEKKSEKEILENNKKEIERVIEDLSSYKKCKTDILQNVKFETKEDEFLFDSLPLTMAQKEELLLSMYKV